MSRIFNIFKPTSCASKKNGHPFVRGFYAYSISLNPHLVQVKKNLCIFNVLEPTSCASKKNGHPFVRGSRLKGRIFRSVVSAIFAKMMNCWSFFIFISFRIRFRFRFRISGFIGQIFRKFDRLGPNDRFGVRRNFVFRFAQKTFDLQTILLRIWQNCPTFAAKWIIPFERQRICHFNLRKATNFSSQP